MTETVQDLIPARSDKGLFAPGNTINKMRADRVGSAGLEGIKRRQFREKLQQFSELNFDQVQGWFGEVAAKDPAEAIRLYLNLLEFCLPKLARVEHSGEGGRELVVNLVNFGNHTTG